MVLERRFDLYSSDARVDYTRLGSQNTMLKRALGSPKVLDRISRNPDLSDPIWRAKAGQVITATSLYLLGKDPEVMIALSDGERMESVVHFLAQTGREAVIRGFLRLNDISVSTYKDDLRSYFEEYEIPVEHRGRSARTFAFFYGAVARMFDTGRDNYGSIAAQMTGLDKEEGAILMELVIPQKAGIKNPEKILREEKIQNSALAIFSQLSQVAQGKLTIEEMDKPDGERIAEKAFLYNFLIAKVIEESEEGEEMSQIAEEIIQLAVSTGWLEEGKAQLLADAGEDVNALGVLRDGSAAELESLLS